LVSRFIPSGIPESVRNFVGDEFGSNLEVYSWLRMEFANSLPIKLQIFKNYYDSTWASNSPLKSGKIELILKTSEVQF